jgi:antitoxin component YwqK of YwqJK toxin-antitoxin module
MFEILFGKRKPCLKEGRWKEFNKHAVVISVGNYVNDKKHGDWREYYDTGELMLEETYLNGVVHGRFATYHPNGMLLSEGMFEHGSREGYFKVYDEFGVHTKSLLFIADDLMEEVENKRMQVLTV